MGQHVLSLPLAATSSCGLHTEAGLQPKEIDRFTVARRRVSPPEAQDLHGRLEAALVPLSYPPIRIPVFPGLVCEQGQTWRWATLVTFLKLVQTSLVSTRGWVLWKSTPCNFELLSHLLGAVPEEFHPTYLQPTLPGFLLETTWNRKCLCSLHPQLRTELAELRVEIKGADSVPGLEVG